jgi:hypothetical protein
MLDMLIERIMIQLSSLGGYRMNLRGVVVVETVQTTMFRGFLGGRDSGVALSLGAEPITPLINSDLSMSRNI